MSFTGIGIHNFRNLENREELDVSQQKIFLVGNNGTGKTNFLDSLYTLCYGTSFRSNDRDSAKHGTDSWSLSASKNIGILCDSISVAWSQTLGKTITINGKRIADRKDLIQQSPAILFSYDDLSFVQGSQDYRRMFMDQSASLCNRAYIDALRNFKKILKTRNIAIKENNTKLFDVCTIQFSEFASRLVGYRLEVIGLLNSVFSETVYRITNKSCRLSLIYKPSMDRTTASAMYDELEKIRDREYLSGMSLKGPHRDRLVFNDEIGDFSLRASMGQLRAIALSLRIAQSLIFSQISGINPIHLYDDVLLELDYEKRIQFMQHLPPSRQSFFTFLPVEPLEEYTDGNTMLYEVIDGKFIHRKSL